MKAEIKFSQKNNSLKRIYFILFILALALIFFGKPSVKVFSQAVDPLVPGLVDAVDNAVLYQSAYDSVKNLVNHFPTDVLSSATMQQLQQFIALPLEIGQVGNPNLFNLPTPPDASKSAGL